MYFDWCLRRPSASATRRHIRNYSSSKEISAISCPCTFFSASSSSSTMWLFALTLFAFLQGALALKLSEMRVPLHPVVGARVVLECIYDMEGADVYSVKWYKGNSEFYRFLPKDNPPAQVYDIEGIKVDTQKSDLNKVTLKEVSLASSGIYRCEISAEAPSFTTVSKESDMFVIDLPEDGPKITGGRPKYHVGDTVHVNCTSYRSKPAAMLSWTINGDQANKDHLREFLPHIDEDGLETSVLGLEFRVRENHFRVGEMKLRCTASIAPDYHQSNEESVVGGNQQASVLESRETPSQVHNNGARNDLQSWTAGFLLLIVTLLSIR